MSAVVLWTCIDVLFVVVYLILLFFRSLGIDALTTGWMIIPVNLLGKCTYNCHR